MKLDNSRLKVYEIKFISDNYLLISLNQPLFKIKYKLGQFFTFQFTLFDKSVIYRSYSVISKENSNSIDFIIKIEKDGVGSNFLLKNFKNIEHLTVSGPYGNFLSDYNPKNKTYLWASGIGLTPFIPLLRETHEKIIFNWSIKKNSDLKILSEINVPIHNNFNVYSKEIGNKLIFDNLTPEDVNLKSDHYICGSNKYLDEISKKLKKFNPSKIIFEKFDNSNLIPTEIKEISGKISFKKIFDHTNSNSILESLIKTELVNSDFYSCMSGHCKKCHLKISDGSCFEIVDNEFIEKKVGECILSCKSFIKTKNIKLLEV